MLLAHARISELVSGIRTTSHLAIVSLLFGSCVTPRKTGQVCSLFLYDCYIGKSTTVVLCRSRLGVALVRHNYGATTYLLFYRTIYIRILARVDKGEDTR